jgi:hypothetical protein
MQQRPKPNDVVHYPTYFTLRCLTDKGVEDKTKEPSPWIVKLLQVIDWNNRDLVTLWTNVVSTPLEEREIIMGITHNRTEFACELSQLVFFSLFQKDEADLKKIFSFEEQVGVSYTEDELAERLVCYKNMPNVKKILTEKEKEELDLVVKKRIMFRSLLADYARVIERSEAESKKNNTPLPSNHLFDLEATLQSKRANDLHAKKQSLLKVKESVNELQNKISQRNAEEDCEKSINNAASISNSNIPLKSPSQNNSSADATNAGLEPELQTLSLEDEVHSLNKVFELELDGTDEIDVTVG